MLIRVTGGSWSKRETPALQFNADSRKGKKLEAFSSSEASPVLLDQHEKR